MAKISGRLTKQQINKWIVENERFEAKSDGANLWIRYRREDLYPRWFFRYTLAGKQSFVALGSYRDVSLAAARNEAAKLRGAIAQGIDVAQERKSQRSAAARSFTDSANTVAWLADEYFKRYVAGRVKHPDIVRSMIENRVKPALGALALIDVRPAHIDSLIRDTALTAPTVSTKLLSRLKLIFNLGIKLGHIQFNPASAFDARDAGGASSPRTRWLARSEIGALFRAMGLAQGWNIQNTLTVKLLLMLAVRKSELLQARVDEFRLDEAVWHLPSERTKSGSALDIPLVPQAVEALRELVRLGGGSEWLFPARKMQTRMTPFVGPDTVNAALAKSVKPHMADIDAFVLHDLRRTARTHLEALGVNPLVAERCLNHKIKGLVGVYNRHDYFDERRAALQKWADYLSDIELEAMSAASVRSS